MAPQVLFCLLADRVNHIPRPRRAHEGLSPQTTIQMKAKQHQARAHHARQHHHMPLLRGGGLIMPSTPQLLGRTQIMNGPTASTLLVDHID